MPNNAQYRYDCLKGGHPQQPWGFIKTRCITQLIASEEKQRLLASNLSRFVAVTPMLREAMTAEDSVILIKGDGNCSARTIFFGVLISASIAIKNQTMDALAMQAAVQVLYTNAVELRGLYQRQSSGLIFQSQAFPFAGNSVIALIQAVFHNQISTTELVYQANKDCVQGVTSSLNLAFTDLLHYVLYNAALSSVKTAQSSLSDEIEKVRLICGNKDKACRGMADLLKTGVHYTPLALELVSGYLNISSQMLSIANNVSLGITLIGRKDYPIAFTTVTAFGHMDLLLDARMRRQIMLELSYRQNSTFDDIEARFKLPGFNYTPIIVPADELHIARDHYRTLCEEAARFIHAPVFSTKLVGVCDLFFSKIRPLAWQLEKRDVLSELEEVLYRWHAHLNHSSDLNHPAIKENQVLIRGVLCDLYQGERGTVPALFNEPSNLHLIFCIGGLGDPDASVVVDMGELCLHPKDYQSFLVLMVGLNRTSIRANRVDYPTHLNAMADYVMRMMEFPFITQQMRDHIQSMILIFLKNEIKNMPQHVIQVGDPGYEDYLNELKNINCASRRFNSAWREICQFNQVEEHKGFPGDVQFPAHDEPDQAEFNGASNTVASSTVNDVLSWPDGPDDFTLSIRNTVLCRAQWIQRLGEQEVGFITAYFKTLSELIQDLPHEGDAERLTQNLASFAKTLLLQSTLFGIKIMMNTAKDALSPTITQRRRLHPVRIDETHRLPGGLETIRARTSQVDNLLQQNTMTRKPTRENERVIQMELQPHLHTEMPVLFNQRRTQTPIPTLAMHASELSERETDTGLLNQLIQQMADAKNTQEAHFNHRRSAFTTRLKALLEKYPEEKQAIVNNALKSLQNKTMRQRSNNLVSVTIYLQRLLKRIQEPIIDADVAIEFEQLVERYSRREATPWQIEKRSFLIALQIEIKNNPEKSYRACFHTVRDDPTHQFNKLFTMSRYLRHSFFGNSSISNMVDSLEALDVSTLSM